jgi:hypothetical protein
VGLAGLFYAEAEDPGGMDSDQRLVGQACASAGAPYRVGGAPDLQEASAPRVGRGAVMNYERGCRLGPPLRQVPPDSRVVSRGVVQY